MNAQAFAGGFGEEFVSGCHVEYDGGGEVGGGYGSPSRAYVT